MIIMRLLLLVGATTPAVIYSNVDGHGGGRCAIVEVDVLLTSMVVVRHLSYPQARDIAISTSSM